MEPNESKSIQQKASKKIEQNFTETIEQNASQGFLTCLWQSNRKKTNGQSAWETFH